MLFYSPLNKFLFLHGRYVGAVCKGFLDLLLCNSTWHVNRNSVWLYVPQKTCGWVCDILHITQLLGDTHFYSHLKTWLSSAVLPSGELNQFREAETNNGPIACEEHACRLQRFYLQRSAAWRHCLIDWKSDILSCPSAHPRYPHHTAGIRGGGAK